MEGSYKFVILRSGDVAVRVGASWPKSSVVTILFLLNPCVLADSSVSPRTAGMGSSLGISYVQLATLD